MKSFNLTAAERRGLLISVVLFAAAALVPLVADGYPLQISISIVMYTALRAVPTELYDAAKVDGANAIYRFFRISIPLISPVIFYCLVLAVIAAFQYFLTAYVLFQNTAGPNNSALFYMMNLYKEAFVYYHMGYASALAWGLFIVGLIVTIALFAGARRYVYYAGGDR